MTGWKKQMRKNYGSKGPKAQRMRLCENLIPTDINGGTERDPFLIESDEEDIFFVGFNKRRKVVKQRSRVKQDDYPPSAHRRNQPLRPSQQRLTSYTFKDCVICEHDFIELSDNLNFLRIAAIVQDTSTGQVHLRGHTFRRASGVLGFPAANNNEVCWVMEIDQDDPREAQVQSIETVSIGDILRKRILRFANHKHHNENQTRLRTNDPEFSSTEILICRSKVVTTYSNAGARQKDIKAERAIIFLTFGECSQTDKYRVPDPQLRQRWRGETSKHGAQKTWLEGEQEFLRHEILSSQGKPCNGFLRTRDRTYDDDEAMKRGAVAGILVQDPEELQIYHKVLGMGGRYPEYSKIDIETRQILQNSSLESPFFDSEIIEISEDEDENELQLIEVLSLDTANADQMRTSQTNFTSPNTSGLTVEAQADICHEQLEGGVESGTRPPEIRLLPTEDTEIGRNVNDEGDDEVVFVASSLQHSNPWPNGAKGEPKPIAPEKYTPKMPEQRYTIGDCFCGGGGMSRGAVLAGYRVSWGFDKDFDACKTFALNFFEADTFYASVDELCRSDNKANLKVDVCHISPPCQPFSPVHTTCGQNDEQNRATLLSVGAILDKTRPRIVVLEETDGLEKNWKDWFGACLQMFVERGFSLRYKTLFCADYGVTQRRPRLFIIASW